MRVSSLRSSGQNISFVHCERSYMQNFFCTTTILTLISTWNALAGNTPFTSKWFIQPKIFGVYHAPSMNLAAGRGMGFQLGRVYHRQWSLGWDFAYHPTTQSVTLFGNARQLQGAWYRTAITFQKHWWLATKQRCAIFTEAEAGLLHIRMRAAQIPGGAAGALNLPAQVDNKFAPAFGAGLLVRVWQRWAVLSFVKNHLTRWDERRLEQAASNRVWKSYWQAGAGMSYFF